MPKYICINTSNEDRCPHVEEHNNLDEVVDAMFKNGGPFSVVLETLDGSTWEAIYAEYIYFGDRPIVS